MNTPRMYRIVARYFKEEWKVVTFDWWGTYNNAGIVASGVAQALDVKYGPAHYWNVMLRNPESGDDYYEFFHGRTS